MRRTIRTCTCCESKQPMRDDIDGAQVVCDMCTGHTKTHGETLGRTLARQEAHVVIWRDLAKRIGAAFDELTVKLDSEKASSYQSRESNRRLRGLLDTLSDFHQRKPVGRRCECGLMWPCKSGEFLERTYGRVYASHVVDAELHRLSEQSAGDHPGAVDRG
jgi:hypothetical protein